MSEPEGAQFTEPYDAEYWRGEEDEGEPGDLAGMGPSAEDLEHSPHDAAHPATDAELEPGG
jgi:hypothetical protein